MTHLYHNYIPQYKIYPFVIIITSATELIVICRTLHPNACTLRVITDGCVVLLKL